ncbi:MAG: Maf family protein [Polyangiaceae bacterium]
MKTRAPYHDVDFLGGLTNIGEQMSQTFLLASASPRRADILRGLGLTFDVWAPQVDEAVYEGESVDEYLLRVVESKLLAAADAADETKRFVLVADTAVVLDGDILGKPTSREHAARMLEGLAARTHHVLTRFAVAELAGGGHHGASRRLERIIADTVATVVTFRSLTPNQIEAYIATGEPMDKAGAYGIQGKAACFVRRIEGSYSNVVGLPACEVAEALELLGVLPL